MSVSDSYDKQRCWCNYVMINTSQSQEPPQLGWGANPVCSGVFASPSAASVTFSCHPGLFFLQLGESLCSGWAAEMMLSNLCSISMVSMATVSSDWGQGSNWPIVSKLHFSEWVPLSCYWNRTPALWWIHVVIHSLEGKRGKYKHDTGGLALLKQRGYWMDKHVNASTADAQL